jgi:hypothetical protein
MVTPSIYQREHPARKGHKAKLDLPDLPGRKEVQVHQVLLALPDHKAPPEQASIYWAPFLR